MYLRRGLITAGFCAAMSASAIAQLHVNTNTNDPITGLDAPAWEVMIQNIIDGGGLIGEPGVLAVNSTPNDLTVTCDTWELVGDNVYKSVRGNPARLRPFSVTYIRTEGFDGYCKDGLVGHTRMNRTYTATLNSSDHTFKNATIITFSGSDKAK